MKILAIVIVVCWAAFCIFRIEDFYELRPFFTGRHSFEGIYAVTPAGLITRAECYGITALLCFAIVCLAPDKRIPVVSGMGERSLSIYFWHRPVVYILEEFGVLEFCFQLPHGWIRMILLALILGSRLCDRPFVWLKRTMIQGSAEPASIIKYTLITG